MQDAVTQTPFGAPVEPEVNRIYARSSPDTHAVRSTDSKAESRSGAAATAASNCSRSTVCAEIPASGRSSTASSSGSPICPAMFATRSGGNRMAIHWHVRMPRFQASMEALDHTGRFMPVHHHRFLHWVAALPYQGRNTLRRAPVRTICLAFAIGRLQGNPFRKLFCITQCAFEILHDSPIPRKRRRHCSIRERPHRPIMLLRFD